MNKMERNGQGYDFSANYTLEIKYKSFLPAALNDYIISLKCFDNILEFHRMQAHQIKIREVISEEKINL